MLTKILVTFLVILGVITFYRFKNSRHGDARANSGTAPAPRNDRFGRMVAYGFVGVLILISAVWYGLHWREQHRIITVRVIGNSRATVYKAYNKDLKGSRLETIDGKTVILGESERVEIIGAR